MLNFRVFQVFLTVTRHEKMFCRWLLQNLELDDLLEFWDWEGRSEDMQASWAIKPKVC